MPELQQGNHMNADVEKAVEAVRAALNDWTATYASEFCDEDAVTAAYKRISNEGTLGYICDAHGALGKISQALRDQDTEIARLRNVANEYNQCIRHMSGGGDFFEFQRDITAHLGGEHV